MLKMIDEFYDEFCIIEDVNEDDEEYVQEQHRIQLEKLERESDESYNTPCRGCGRCMRCLGLRWEDF